MPSDLQSTIHGFQASVSYPDRSYHTSGTTFPYLSYRFLSRAGLYRCGFHNSMPSQSLYPSGCRFQKNILRSSSHMHHIPVWYLHICILLFHKSDDGQYRWSLFRSYQWCSNCPFAHLLKWLRHLLLNLPRSFLSSLNVSLIIRSALRYYICQSCLCSR